MKFKTYDCIIFFPVEKKWKNVGNQTVSVDFHYMDTNTIEVNENETAWFTLWETIPLQLVLINVPPKTCRWMIYIFNQTIKTHKLQMN